MIEANKVDKIYEVEFDQLVEGEKTPLNSSQEIMNAVCEVTVCMGTAKEKLERIVNLKVGDVIHLEKHVEEALDINVNGHILASGESIIIDNKLAVRLSSVKAPEEEE